MSFGELLFLSFLVLMVFGPQKLPEIARTVAKLTAELRRASNEFRYSLEEEIRAIDVREQQAKRAAAPPALPPAPGSVAQRWPAPAEPVAAADPAAAEPAAEPEPPAVAQVAPTDPPPSVIMTKAASAPPQ